MMLIFRLLWKAFVAIVRAIFSLIFGKLSQPQSYFSKEYLAYIKSANWKAKREQVFAKYGRRCSALGCGATTNLQVDHKRYPKRGASIEAFKRQGLGDFQVLCATCHTRKTRADRRSKKKRSG